MLNCPISIHQQRMEHKNRLDGKSSSLNDGRLARLQSIGFRWAKRKALPFGEEEALKREEEGGKKGSESQKKTWVKNVNVDRETYLLTTEKDKDSLSDRQCFVRSHLVEVFVANKADIAARHSRGGSQKLSEDQIGLRCAYCVKLKPRDRAQRAICYPSSISRIFQAVADMQRFHFESCAAIPPKMLAEYKLLKTTRPKGVCSPREYWDKSAREIGLVDSSTGIKIGEEDGMKSMVKQRKGATGVLETSEAAPPVGEYPTKSMNEFALSSSELNFWELRYNELVSLYYAVLFLSSCILHTSYSFVCISSA